MVQPAKGALYSRDSLIWQINSQVFVLLGGPRAAIMQVCDPGVAAGVAEFSSYRSDPLGRLERTLDAMLAISFGSPQRREAVLAGLEKAHEKVRGRMADGTEYDAMDPHRQFWVLATLTDTVIEVDRRYMGKLKPDDRIRYYEESKRIAAAFGIPEDVVPPDFDAFGDYMAERIATLRPTDQSREVAATLLVPRLRYVPGVAWLPLTLVTTELLPRRLRRGLAIRDLHPAELAVVRAGQVTMRNSLAHVGGLLAANPINGRAIRHAA
jgi:uncharacterized protein (DUF2236 family)